MVSGSVYHFVSRTCCVAAGLMLAGGTLMAQQPLKSDSTKTYAIPEITVTDRLKSSGTRASAPVQALSATKLGQLSVLQISDAIKYFSGVTVKDYGGIGGLKTVSVRSLGANHTAVSYDGITLTDCQTGQIDLGRFSLENVEMVAINNGQDDNIFQPARLFASSSVLSIKTLLPKFANGKNLNVKIDLKAGSFGLWNPSLHFEKKIGPRYAASFQGEWLSANGRYPYRLNYGNQATDSASTEIRQNTDVRNLRLETALYGRFSENDNGYIKAYFYQSERGLPGATILYNAESSSKQRVWDNTFFTQLHYQKSWSDKWSWQANAKYNRGYLHYLDPTYMNSEQKLDNSYVQQEYYGSGSLLFRATENWSFTTSSDAAFGTLHSDLSGFGQAGRFTWLGSAAAKYISEHLLATASLLATVIDESGKSDVSGRDYSRLSPYVSATLRPFLKQDFHIRAFYKNIFQVPTFNDLYYPAVGNRDLIPEKADQYNIGLTYSRQAAKWLPFFTITVDGYHNRVRDKIVSFPNKNTFGWTTLNLGKVNIDGLDMTGEAIIGLRKKANLVLGTSYTYQRALNVTDPNDRGYKNQIPYTPRISGSVKAGVETPWATLMYSVLWSGHRYILFQNYAENRLPGYSDHSLTISREVKLNDKTLFGSFEVLNLLNENYAIVKWFPMPGRSFRVSASLRF